MPAQAQPALDPAGQWITTGGKHVHIDSAGVVDAGGYPGMRTGSPVYDGFPGDSRRDLGAEVKLPKALVAHAAKWTRSLSADEMSAVTRYTGEGFKLVNGGVKACPETLDCLGLRGYRLYTRLQSAIEKAGPLPRPVVAYRGFRSEPEKKDALLRAARAALHTKEPMALAGFQSVSLDPVTASRFAGMTGNRERENPSGGLVFEMTCVSGAPVGLTDEVSMLGDTEKELLLNHNCKFRVTGIEYGVAFGSGRDAARHTVVKLEQLDEGSTVTPKNPTKPGWKGAVQKAGALAADLIGLSADDVILAPESLAVLAPLVVFDDAPPFPPKKKPAPFPPKGGPPKGAVKGPPAPAHVPGSDVPLAIKAKKHKETVEKHNHDLAAALPGHGNGPVSANEKNLRDTHAKIRDHLAKKAMSGQWGPAEAGLQHMHDHLAGVLSQHDQHHAKQHAEAEQLAHHEAALKTAEEQKIGRAHV